jgi:ABC-2 type transport system permease protein
MKFQIIKQTFAKGWLWWFLGLCIMTMNFFAYIPLFAKNDGGIAILNAYTNQNIGGNGVIGLTVIAMLLANLFITSEVDRGTLAVTLCTPVNRREIILSKLFIFILLVSSASLICGVLGSVVPTVFGYDFLHAKWWTVIALYFMYSLLLGGIAFLIGCWFNKARYALAITALIFLAFYLFGMLGASGDLSFLKYLTLQTLFDMSAVLKGQSVIWQIIVMPILAIPCYIIGVIKFLKKDLPL